MIGKPVPSAARNWRDHAVAGFPHRRARQAAGFLGMRQARHRVARQRGVGGDDAVHAVALQRGRDHLDLRLVEVGRDLHEQRHPLALPRGQRLALVGDRAEQGVERLVALQRAQVGGVGARDVDRHVVGVRIDAVQADQVVVDRALDRRGRVLADVEAQQHRRLGRVAPEARALHVGDEGVEPFVVEAEPVDQRVALRQAEHARLRVAGLRPWA